MKKIATIKEIAQRLNVSISTVSRALHDHPAIGLRTKMRVQQLAKELDYEPNHKAIFFKQGKTYTLGVILPFLGEEFFSQAISGIEDEAFTHHYNVLIGQSHDSLEKERQIIDTFKKHRVDGLLVSVSKDTKRTDHFTSLEKYNIPVVYFDRAPNNAEIHKVTCDLYQSSIDIINFLWKQGHRRIALIKGPQSLQASTERFKGFIDGLSKKRLKSDPSLFATTNLTRESTWAAMEDILSQKKKPTAVIAFNDYVALDAMQYARQKKLAINKELCFVSYANLSICNYLEHPPIASVEQFPYEQGRKATEIMMELLNIPPDELTYTEPRQIAIESKLVVHGS